MQASHRIEDLCALRRFAIGADERLRGREFLLRVASLQREPMHRHQGMADAEPFDEVRIGQSTGEWPPSAVCGRPALPDPFELEVDFPSEHRIETRDHALRLLLLLPVDVPADLEIYAPEIVGLS